MPGAEWAKIINEQSYFVIKYKSKYVDSSSLTGGMQMEYGEILHSKFSEPAAVISYQNGYPILIDINDRFLEELWMNISKQEF